MPQIPSDQLSSLINSFTLAAQRLLTYGLTHKLANSAFMELQNTGNLIMQDVGNIYNLAQPDLVPETIEGLLQVAGLIEKFFLEPNPIEAILLQTQKVKDLLIALMSFNDGSIQDALAADWGIEIASNQFATSQSSFTAPPQNSPAAPSPTEKKPEPPKTNAKKGYWLLKLSYKTWDKKYKEGTRSIMYTTHVNGVPRPRYDLFKRLKPGEPAIGYGFGEVDGVMFQLEVESGIQQDPSHGEVVYFSIIKRVEPIILLSAFADKVPSVNNFKGSPQTRLFELTADQYTSILGSAPVSGDAYISAIATDSPSAKLVDALDFASDVNALAAIIAYKEVQPPLAIGLFGNWGTGKSFFMNKLRDRIEEVQQTAAKNKNATPPLPTNYCAEIVHVQFNSWHYSDANLWASIMTNIFDGLKKYSEQNKAGELKALFNNLHSTKELREKTEEEKKKAEINIEALKQEEIHLNQKIQESKQNLSNLEFKDYAVTIVENPEIKHQLDELKAAVKKDMPGDEEVKATVAGLQTTGAKISKTISIVYSGKSGRAIAVALLISAGCFGLAYLIKTNNLLKYISAAGACVSTLLYPLLKVAPGIYEKITTAVERFNATYNELQKKAEDKFSEQKAELNVRLEAAKIDHEKKQEEINTLDLHRQQLQTALDDIASGKKVLQFVEDRVADVRYTSGLGIISWIRKDFEELDFLLKQQFDPDFKEEKGRKKVPDVYHIERIVLYIDDLDRCEMDIVDNVLKAIHLLLAFPLFVVVVGVDPRWMHNALNKKYGSLLGQPDEKEITEEAPFTEERPATSYDYLEKIFQVPFALKPMGLHGKNVLITQQLNVKDEDELVDQVVSPGPKTNGDANAATTDPVVAPVNKKPNKVTADAQLPPVSEKLLEIKKTEESFMQEIGFMIGESPRSVKRYINIYRILRVHPRFVLKGQTSDEDYFAAMVLLALLTNTPECAAAFFTRIRLLNDDSESKKPTLFKDFFKAFLAEDGKEAKLLDQLAKKMSTDTIVNRLKTIEMRVFKANIELIRRFSFRGVA